MAETVAADQVGPMLASTATTRSLSVSTRHGKLWERRARWDKTTCTLSSHAQPEDGERLLWHTTCSTAHGVGASESTNEGTLLVARSLDGPDARSHARRASVSACQTQSAGTKSFLAASPVVGQISPRREQWRSRKSPADAIYETAALKCASPPACLNQGSAATGSSEVPRPECCRPGSSGDGARGGLPSPPVSLESAPSHKASPRHNVDFPVTRTPDQPLCPPELLTTVVPRT